MGLKIRNWGVCHLINFKKKRKKLGCVVVVVVGTNLLKVLTTNQ